MTAWPKHIKLALKEAESLGAEARVELTSSRYRLVIEKHGRSEPVIASRVCSMMRTQRNIISDVRQAVRKLEAGAPVK